LINAHIYHFIVIALSHYLPKNQCTKCKHYAFLR